MAGLVHVDNVTNCCNSGKIEFDATISSGGQGYYVGTQAVSSIGGVIGDIVGGYVTGCKNTGEMDVLMHMRTTNATAAAIGGVVGTTFNTQLTNCSNEGICTWKPRTNQCFLGGVCGYFVTDKAPSNCSNKGNLTCDAGASVEDKQSAAISFGGVFGAVISSVSFGPTVTGYSNTGNLTYSGGNTGEKRIGGVFGYGEQAKAFYHCFIDVAGGYMNGENGSADKGKITVKETVADCFVGGVHGKIQMHGTGTGVSIHSCTNYAPVNVSTTGNAWVGGVVGNYTRLSAYAMTNKGAVTVSAGGTEVVAGGIAGLGYAVTGAPKNDGNVTVTATNPDAVVRVAGIQANYNFDGSNYGGYTSGTSYNNGAITLNTSAATSYVSGVITHSFSAIPTSSQGKIKCTYTGTANNPVVYASLGIAEMLEHTNNGIGGIYNADVELSGFPETAQKYVGIMAGRIAGTRQDGTTTLQFKANELSVKKGIKIGGTEVTADNYKSLLVGEIGSGAKDNSPTTGVTLID